MKEKNFGHAQKPSTNIWYEKPSDNNPYVAQERRLHGYNMLTLCQQKSFTEVLFLLFKGELPSPSQNRLFELLMVAFINPGPRHPATRAAMTAGISKTNTPHILPVGLMVLGGQQNGAMDVEQTMGFIKSHQHQNVADFIHQQPMKTAPADGQDWHPYPGLGSSFGSHDLISAQLAHVFAKLPSGQAFNWMQQLIKQIDHPNVNWLPVGLFAAILLDLAFAPREGGTLYQLFGAPGVAAHGLEQTHKPLTSMPLLDDDHYVLS